MKVFERLLTNFLKFKYLFKDLQKNFFVKEVSIKINKFGQPWFIYFKILYERLTIAS